ncbi:DUF2931 family protein [Flavobacterium branchiarum]|nr:DUF2931 family protein [Flavobacterium branchiarum]MDN3671796.1 DUF2931 family protein [Flavobacterium branchiarum]
MSIACFVFCTQLLQCQMIQPLPEFHVEICSPDNKYRIEPIYDTIKTLEGVPAGLPYGGSSGRWGDSGSVWTSQKGTPIGADITYYSGYEDVFYRLNIDFPSETIKDYMERAYSAYDDRNGETQEYKRLGRRYESGGGEAYDSFSTLVFGFAPKGMVMVWMNFGTTRIELGRYQAQEVIDDVIINKASKKHLEKYRITPERFEEEKEILHISDASPSRWDNYRNRYNWRPEIISESPSFELLQILNSYYNGEVEYMLRPWVSNAPYKERAVPQEINVVWLTGENHEVKKQAFIYLSWIKANEAFTNSGDKFDMQIKIAKNNSIQVFLNGQPFEVESIRVFDWSPSMLNGGMYKNVKKIE